jgi:putative ABC transport system permease protein
MVFVNSSSPIIFIFSGTFSLLTVFFGCRKPGKMAARISPVEALKFSGVSGEMKKKSQRTRKVTPLSMAWANVTREKRKLYVVVLSLSLSLILLNSAFSAAHSFDSEAFLREFAVSDFAVADAALYNNMTILDQANKITPYFLAKLAEWGVTEKGVVFHYANLEHHLPPVMHENFAAYFEANHEDLQRHWRFAIPAYEQVLSDGRLPIKIYGFGRLPLESFTNEYERLSSGNYALISSASAYAEGDRITLTNEAGQTREFEIIAAVGDVPFSVSSRHAFIPGQTIMLADNIFTEFFAPSGAMQVHFNVEPERLDETEAWLIEYTSARNQGLGYISRNTLMAEFEGLQMTYITMGGAMSAILALVGILNFVNAVVASIIARRHEFAMLQSVGMTGKQLRQTLFFEGTFYTALTAIFTLTAGLGIGRLIVRVIAGQAWFFNQNFTVLPSVLSLAPLLIICAIVPLVCYAKLNRNSLVERLRVE